MRRLERPLRLGGSGWLRSPATRKMWDLAANQLQSFCGCRWSSDAVTSIGTGWLPDDNHDTESVGETATDSASYSEGSSWALTCPKAVSTAAVRVLVAVKVRWGMAPCLTVRKVRSMSFSSGL